MKLYTPLVKHYRARQADRRSGKSSRDKRASLLQVGVLKCFIEKAQEEEELTTRL